jgi:hypothetical protein
MYSVASVVGRFLPGPYLTRSSDFHGSVQPHVFSSHLKKWCRFRCRVLVPPWVLASR